MRHFGAKSLTFQLKRQLPKLVRTPDSYSASRWAELSIWLPADLHDCAASFTTPIESTFRRSTGRLMTA